MSQPSGHVGLSMPVRAFEERQPSLKAGAREAENHDDTLCPYQAGCQGNSPRRAEILGACCTNVAHVKARLDQMPLSMVRRAANGERKIGISGSVARALLQLDSLLIVTALPIESAQFNLCSSGPALSHPRRSSASCDRQPQAPGHRQP
jgi:hypothetical protein